MLWSVCIQLRGREDISLRDRKSTRLNSSHSQISYAVFCLKKKKQRRNNRTSENIEPRDDENLTAHLVALHERPRIDGNTVERDIPSRAHHAVADQNNHTAA